jgi:hypothetical protein
MRILRCDRCELEYDTERVIRSDLGTIPSPTICRYKLSTYEATVDWETKISEKDLCENCVGAVSSVMNTKAPTKAKR